MIRAAFVIAICVAGLIGWWARDIWERLRLLAEQISHIGQETKKDQQPEKPSMDFSEPMDPIEYAAWEEKERIKRLNGQ